MRITFFKISAGMLCAAAMVSTAFAEGFSSGNNAPSAGYDSSNSAPPPQSSFSNGSPYPPSSGGYASDSYAPPSSVNYDSDSQAPEPKRKKHNRFAISLNIPGTDTVLTYREPKHGKHHNDRQQTYWVPMHTSNNIPANAVISGSQYNPGASSMFYVCRANYRGGVHPGKLFGGSCNISWGGREMVMRNFEVLVSQAPLAWVDGSYGSIPHHALPGGTENHQTLYICQADYENGTHSGKVVGKSCNFGWGGREISSSYYKVLVG